MMPDLKEIKLSREGRSYRTWWSQPHPGTKYGLKYNANWVIFPTKYEWHTADLANKWICPIRDCRNIFPTIKKLEAHTMVCPSCCISSSLAVIFFLSFVRRNVVKVGHGEMCQI